MADATPIDRTRVYYAGGWPAMKAVLTVRALPGLESARELKVDCRHGTTTIYMVQPARVLFDDDTLIALALARHDEEEGCGCTSGLWARYSGTSRN